MPARAIRFAAAIAAAALASAAIRRTAASYRRDIGRASAAAATGSRIVETRCGRIEYAAVGDGPPVLVVHGAGGGFDQGLGFGMPLVERGLRVIAMSRFGYLRTPLPGDASPAAQADAHACLLDALRVDRAVIVGTSAGAPSAMQFALRHADRCAGLVLLVPAAFVPRPGGAPPVRPSAGTDLMVDTALRSDLLFWVATKVAREALVRFLLATPPEVVRRATEGEQRRVASIIEHLLPVSPRRLGLMNDSRVVSTLPRYELERIAPPTLAISVKDDLYGTFDVARYTAGHIPGARFRGYASGGHVWVGHQEEIIGEIAAFALDEHARTCERSSAKQASR